MSDLLATALGLGFTLLVCLLAIQAILSPWLRVRRAPYRTSVDSKQATAAASDVASPQSAPAHS